MKVLITGATGFIGQALSAELLKKEFDLTVVLRKKSALFTDSVNQIVVSDFSANTNWDSLVFDLRNTSSRYRISRPI